MFPISFCPPEPRIFGLVHPECPLCPLPTIWGNSTHRPQPAVSLHWGTLSRGCITVPAGLSYPLQTPAGECPTCSMCEYLQHIIYSRQNLKIVEIKHAWMEDLCILLHSVHMQCPLQINFLIFLIVEKYTPYNYRTCWRIITFINFLQDESNPLIIVCASRVHGKKAKVIANSEYFL